MALLLDTLLCHLTIVFFLGALMFVAWMTTVSVGVIVARFFKPLWPHSLLFGEEIWFQVGGKPKCGSAAPSVLCTNSVKNLGGNLVYAPKTLLAGS